MIKTFARKAACVAAGLMLSFGALAAAGGDLQQSGTDPSAPTITLDGEDVSAEIRGPEVTALVSAVSALPEVRTRMVAPTPSRMKSTWVGTSRTGSSWKSRGITRCLVPSTSMS